MVPARCGSPLEEAPMKHVLVVFANPKEGREDAFRDWYRTTNVETILGLEGICALQRFELAAEGAGEVPGQFLGLYEIEEGKLEAARAAMNDAVARRDRDLAEGRSPDMADPVDQRDTVGWYFTAIAERIEASG
jgi:hypothetical protein